MDDMQTIGDIAKQVADDLEATPNERTETCPKHGEFVSRRYTLYEGGREHWSRCQACQDDTRLAYEAHEASRKASEEARQHEERLNRAGIPTRFRNRTLDAFVADTAPKQRAHAIAKAFAAEFSERYAEGANLIFAGLPGTGKSHLALGIAQAIMPRWYSIYITARELIMRLRATWRQDADVSEIDLQATFTRTHLLIIDEVGVQFGTEAERTQLFGIIDDRYREQMPSILLTNLDVEGFKSFVGQRAFDRLRECGEWVPFDWESYRARKPAQ
jgi:DNA replication protein DnaC